MKICPAFFLPLLDKIGAVWPLKFLCQMILFPASFELFCRIFGQLATVVSAGLADRSISAIPCISCRGGHFCPGRQAVYGARLSQAAGLVSIPPNYLGDGRLLRLFTLVLLTILQQLLKLRNSSRYFDILASQAKELLGF